MTPELSVLIVEDERDAVALITRMLAEGGLDISHRHVESAAAYQEALEHTDWDVILCDFALPNFSAPEALRILLKSGRDIPFIVVSGRIGEETAADMMQDGADDFVNKLNLSRLVPTVRRAVADRVERSRRRMADDIRIRQEKNLRTIVHQNVDGMLILSTNGTILFANPAVQDLLGRGQMELLGEQFGAPVVDQQTVEIELLRDDRSLITVEMRVTQTEWEDEPAILLSLRDISGRKEAENRLRHLNRALTVLSRCNQLLVRATSEQELLDEACRIVVDYGHYRFAWVGLLDPESPRRLTPAAYAGHDSGYLDILRRLLTDNEKVALCPVCVAMERRETVVLEDIKSRVDLPEPWRLAALARGFNAVIILPLFYGDALVGALSIYADSNDVFNADEIQLLDELSRDLGFGVGGIRREQEQRAMVEKLREAESQIQQLQKLESIGRLAGGVAHDFNNVLQSIGGYVDFALREADPESELANDIRSIQELVERAANLTQQLLAFSRRQTLQPEVVNMNVELSAALKLLRRLIGEDVQIQFKPADDLHTVYVDPGQFYQVVMNLAVNARDAMPTGGTIAISTENRAVTEGIMLADGSVAPGDYAVLTVSDSGSGMDAETLDRIFEPFFTTKEMGSGTGLGLSTVFGIVRQHGGAITAHSAPGDGATFEIFFPKSTQSSRTKTLESNKNGGTQGHESILVVEDEAPVREILARILRQSGYTVVLAKDAEEARDVISRHGDEIEMLISDVVVPGMSGLDIYGELSALRPNLPALFMSGYSDDTIINYGVWDSEIPFIQKPFRAPKLLTTIRQILDE